MGIVLAQAMALTPAIAALWRSPGLLAAVHNLTGKDASISAVFPSA